MSEDLPMEDQDRAWWLSLWEVLKKSGCTCEGPSESNSWRPVCADDCVFHGAWAETPEPVS